MKPRNLPLCGLAVLCATALFSPNTAKAQPTIYADAIGDIASGISTGGGTLDIVKMEVSDTTNDVILNLTVNGSVSSVNWGKFMIGVANMKTAGVTNGNGWGRPINLIASSTNGMTHWIGSWVDGGGGANYFTNNGTNWSGASGVSSYSFSVNTNGTSTMSYTVSKASLGVTLGDTIFFDAYSSGGGGSDSAVDALSNPTNSITGWGGPYTSGGTNPISQYTLANSASLITNTVTFSVDMTVQTALTNFLPGIDVVSVAGSYNTWTPQVDVLSDTNNDGIYDGTFNVVSPSGTPVLYKFYINNTAEAGGNRSFDTGINPAPPPLILPTVFYANNPGVRDVEFSVDMTVQETLGNFDPNSMDVVVTGTFNDWNITGTQGNTLSDTNNDGIYTGTISIGGAENSGIQYKFYSFGMPNDGYESIANRTTNLGPIGVPQTLPVVFWNNQTNIPASRPVSFSVDMSVQVANGNFDTNTGVVRPIGNFNGQNYQTDNTAYNLTNVGGNIYSGTFAVSGDAGTTNQYKFYSPGFPVNNGYEIVNPNDLFENRTWVLGISNVQQDLPLVFWSNDDGGATFTNWAQGAPLNSANLALYAIGGASSPTATNGIPSVSTVTSNALSITAIVRTNNPNLSVVGEATENLAAGPWSTNSVTVSNTVDQSGVPYGTARQIFSVPRTTNNQFLRLRATLNP